MVGISSITFPASAAKLAEGPTAVKKALDIIKSTPGNLGAYHGIQIEDGKTAYFSALWSGADAHSAFLKGDKHAAFTAALTELADGPLNAGYIEVSGDPTKAFESPVTEGVHFITKDTDDAPFKALAAAIDSVAPYAWGRNVENKNHVIFFVGWDSVEAHLAVKDKSEDVLSKARAASESYKVAHAKLTKA
ncbi:hypothetical protein C8F04DRAFT_1257738 [Mycena alexandri]|uniref:ABM domain-containing protein n=1 Tax=Mycena alexandri TaxID=1745969 RepID=A0AAD6X8Y4_9AGAR|nr:hypothetical protein C8F04DRAFT_1257738 [Mycena alexandri]